MVADYVQPLLLRPDAPPIVRAERHYVPILLDRAGERDALANATAAQWTRMTPLIQVELRPRQGTDPRPEALRAIARRLRGAVGDHPIYLDLLPLSARRLAAPGRALAAVHDGMRRVGVTFVPVYTAGAHDQAGVIIESLLRDGRGVCVRYKALEHIPGSDDPAAYLRAEVERLEAQLEDADLLVDLGWLDPDRVLTPGEVVAIVAAARAAGPWRTVTLAGTSIPRSLGGIRENSLGLIRRTEWRLWSGIGGSGDVAYADYGIQHPRAPYSGRGGRLRANIRYAAEDGTLVARGEGILYQLPAAEQARQYRELCGWLTMRDEEFGGRDCCWGDALIEDVARGLLVPGSQNMWRGAGTSHHLAVMVRALAALERAARPTRDAAIGARARAQPRDVPAPAQQPVT